MERTKQRKLPVVFESRINPDPTTDSAGAPAPPASGKPAKSLWLEFTALASIPLVLVLGNSMLVPILPDMEREMGISQLQSSLVITLFSVSAGLFIPISGYLSDKFSRKAVIIPGLALYGGAGILAGFAAVWGSYPLLIISRAIQGIGASGTAGIAMALIGDRYDQATESRALGLSEAANGTGKVISPILGSLLSLLIWYAAFFAFPVFCLASILAVSFLIREPRPSSTAPGLSEYIPKVLSLLKQKARWLITAFCTGSLSLFILFGVLFYLSNILEEPPYNIDGVIKGLVLAIPLLGLVATSYITGSVIKKNGILMRWLMNIGLALMTIALTLTIFFNQQMILLIGLLTLSSVGTGLILPCINTLITGSVQKEERGMITSLYNCLRFLGVAVGPPMFNWLMEISHSVVFITVSSLSLVTLLLVFFLIKPDAQVNG